MCSGRGRRGANWKGLTTRARANERGDGTTATKSLWGTALRGRTESHDRRAHHHETTRVKGSTLYPIFTPLLPTWGRISTIIAEKVIIAGLYLSDSSGRHGDRWYLYCGIWFDCQFFRACPRVVASTAHQTAEVFLFVFTTTARFVQCRKLSRQQPL